MSLKQNRKWFVLTLMIFTLAATVFAVAPQSQRNADDVWGARYSVPAQSAVTVNSAAILSSGITTGILRWNEISVNASGLDHTPVAVGENRVFGEQVGPVRAARAIAIVHIAMFDAVNAIQGGYQSFTGLPRANGSTNVNVAIAQAAHDTLVAMFPSQKPSFDELLAQDLGAVADSVSKSNGITLGRKAAKAILALRANDGAVHSEPRVDIDFICSNDAGKWRKDPISLHPLALGAYWGTLVRPLVLQSASQFRCPTPPAMESAEYAAAYNEVKQLGGDGITTPTTRTADQTEIGLYWAYDGTPSLCAPPRLYNQIAVHIAAQMGTTNTLELARLLALIHVAMSEAGITSWESKYFYEVWRPVTGIREADPGTGPSGTGDGNPNTTGDATFSPLGAPASNLNGPNFTPPFPAYPSGHATFGGALFQTLRRFYGTDNIAFTFVSDELNGITKDNQGNVRPLRPRSFTTLSQAEEENGQSRIYLGIHWSYDKTEGIAQGRKVADYVFKRTFLPVPKGAK